MLRLVFFFPVFSCLLEVGQILTFYFLSSSIILWLESGTTINRGNHFSFLSSLHYYANDQPKRKDTRFLSVTALKMVTAILSLQCFVQSFFHLDFLFFLNLRLMITCWFHRLKERTRYKMILRRAPFRCIHWSSEWRWQAWRLIEKTHASSPSTSGKTHEKPSVIQTRR